MRYVPRWLPGTGPPSVSGAGGASGMISINATAARETSAGRKPSSGDSSAAFLVAKLSGLLRHRRWSPAMMNGRATKCTPPVSRTSAFRGAMIERMTGGTAIAASAIIAMNGAMRRFLSPFVSSIVLMADG